MEEAHYATYADFLKAKYRLYSDDEGEDDRPSTAGVSLFTGETELYTDSRPASARPQTRGDAPGYSADRLSRNRAARRAVTDFTTYNHISNLYHLNRRIQQLYAKPGRRSAPRGGVGAVDEAELGPATGGAFNAGCVGTASGLRPGTAPFTSSRPTTAASSRPGTGSPNRIRGAPARQPTYHDPTSYLQPPSRPATAPSPGSSAPLELPAWDPHYYPHLQLQLAQEQRRGRPATAAAAGLTVGAAGPSTGRGLPPVPAASFTERVENTAQALKTAILSEVIENRIYEEGRLRALFRSYLKLNSGEAFYPTLQRVIAELKQELGCE